MNKKWKKTKLYGIKTKRRKLKVRNVLLGALLREK